MENYVWLILVLTSLFSAGVIAYVVHSRQQQQRVHDAEVGVNAFLLERYNTLPTGLRINCSHDLNWPVLVFFSHPVTGLVQRLTFSFVQTPASLLLISEDSIVR